MSSTTPVDDFRDLLEQVTALADTLATTLEAEFADTDDLAADQQRFRAMTETFETVVQPCRWPTTLHAFIQSLVLQKVAEAIRVPFGRRALELSCRNIQADAARGREEMARRTADARKADTEAEERRLTEKLARVQQLKREIAAEVV